MPPRTGQLDTSALTKLHSNNSTRTSPFSVGIATILCVPMSALSVRHSGGVFDPIKFLTASSRLTATSLTSCGSMNGSTSRPSSGFTTFANVVATFSLIIHVFLHFSSTSFFFRMVGGVRVVRFSSFCFSPPNLSHLSHIRSIHTNRAQLGSSSTVKLASRPILVPTNRVGAD